MMTTMVAKKWRIATLLVIIALAITLPLAVFAGNPEAKISLDAESLAAGADLGDKIQIELKGDGSGTDFFDGMTGTAKCQDADKSGGINDAEEAITGSAQTDELIVPGPPYVL